MFDKKGKEILLLFLFTIIFENHLFSAKILEKISQKNECTTCPIPHNKNNFKLSCGHMQCANLLKNQIIDGKNKKNILSAMCSSCNNQITIADMQKLGIDIDIINYFERGYSQLPVSLTERARIDLENQLCPECSHPTQKNTEHNQIICQNCKHQFCWICKRDWLTCNKLISKDNKLGTLACRSVGKDRIEKDEELQRRRQGETPIPTQLEQAIIEQNKSTENQELNNVLKKKRIAVAIIVACGITTKILLDKYKRKTDQNNNDKKNESNKTNIK